jgi:ribosomal-protein-serine acetyltransferase
MTFFSGSGRSVAQIEFRRKDHGMQAILTDQVVMLRPLVLADVEVVYTSARESIKELCRWLPWAHPGYAPTDTTNFIEATLRWWAERSQFTFGIFDATDGTHAGVIGVNHLNTQHRYANIGYWVRTSHTRRGFCSRAVRLAARYAFDTLGMMRVEIAADPDNTASRRVAEKAGATFETIARNRIVMRGRALPAALYSLVPDDVVTSEPQG